MLLANLRWNLIAILLFSHFAHAVPADSTGLNSQSYGKQVYRCYGDTEFSTSDISSDWWRCDGTEGNTTSPCPAGFVATAFVTWEFTQWDLACACFRNVPRCYFKCAKVNAPLNNCRWETIT